MTRRLLLFSSSAIHGRGYLPYEETFRRTLDPTGEILFVPYARPSGTSHDDYTAKVRERFAELGWTVGGTHETADPATRVRDARTIFVGGGNTFLLLRALHDLELLGPIRQAVSDGAVYIGTSAGTNVAGPTIGTTNDMPIVFPGSFDAIGLVPFNINPHYLDPDPDSAHQGETRETRIREFHVHNSQPVVGLREGAWLEVEDDRMLLAGDTGGRLFERGRDAGEFAAGADLSFLL